MTEGSSRKAWKKPVLNVLLRAAPEEQVLLACKGMGTAGPGRPASQGCNQPKQGPCMSQASS